jgi:hypothetical protein
MKYVVEIIESLLLICFIAKLFYWDLILSLSGLDKDRHIWEDLGPYPNWKGLIHSYFTPICPNLHHAPPYEIFTPL